MVKIVADNMEKVLVDPKIILVGKDGKDGKDGLPGPEGLPGRDGKDGRDGANGKDGRDGIDGKDGISYWIEYDKKTNTLIFKNDGGKKSPDPVKLAPLAKGWGYGAGRGGGQVQADWNQTDKNNPTFIKNKPEVHNVSFRIVDKLPTVGDSWTIYLIESSEEGTGDKYEEWVYVYDETQEKYVWEKFGTEVDLSGYLKGVQINGTDLTPDANNKVNIPKASTSNLGVTKINTVYGVGITANGELRTYAASDAEIESKSNTAKPLVPASLNKAIMEGLGNNSLTWSDAYKSNARATLGVNNATITITQGGETKGSFTTNQGTDATIELDAGGGGGDFLPLSGGNITGDLSVKTDLHIGDNLIKIPDEYTIYDYVQTNNQAHFDTGYRGNNNSEYEIEFEYISMSSSGNIYPAILGDRTTSSAQIALSPADRVNGTGDSNNRWASLAQSWAKLGGIKAGYTYHAIMNKTALTVTSDDDPNIKLFSLSFNNETTFTTGNNITIGYINSTNFKSNIKIKNVMIIRENGVEVKRYYPVKRNSDNVF